MTKDELSEEVVKLSFQKVNRYDDLVERAATAVTILKDLKMSETALVLETALYEIEEAERRLRELYRDHPNAPRMVVSCYREES